MSALKSVTMVNIQSHTRTIIDFPQVGIVRFFGNNSNGKSVLVKALSDVVSNAITRPSNRRSLIRRGHSYGELLMTRYDGTTLFIRIDVEAARTYAELTRPDCPPVRRYLADKSIPLLVKEFGWHYESDHGISLNIHQDVDSFLFVDTKKSVNYDLLNTVRSDQFAEASAESLTRLLKESKRQRADFTHAYEIAQATYAALQYWDVEEEQRIQDEYLYLARNLEALDIPPIPEITPVPRVTFYPTIPSMPRVVFPKLLPIFTAQLPDIYSLMVEMRDLASGTCPVCKRKLINKEASHEISV